MVWISDPIQRRTHDAAQGLELFIDRSSSDNETYYRIDGLKNSLQFSASPDQGNLSLKDRKELNISEDIHDDHVVIRLVWGGDKFAADVQKIIAEALIAHKFSFGRDLGAQVFIVRFGKDGAIYRG